MYGDLIIGHRKNHKVGENSGGQSTRGVTRKLLPCGFVPFLGYILGTDIPRRVYGISIPILK